MIIINSIKHHFFKIHLANLYLNNKYHFVGKEKSYQEFDKTPSRTGLINYVLTYLNRDCTYLEIGVRNPNDNFVKINAKEKYSVDPGYEIDINNVDFELTSDDFFAQVAEGKILKKDILFDVIFIDGSHLADQVEKDINNCLQYLKHDGFIIMHDCNPPTAFHATENYGYKLSPSRGFWNGTTWKAFAKNRKRTDIFSCCVDTDWGMGVISKSINLGKSSTIQNEFYEFEVLEKNRKETLNLVSFEEFKKLLP